jgi:hypothetical protein
LFKVHKAEKRGDGSCISAFSLTACCVLRFDHHVKVEWAPSNPKEEYDRKAVEKYGKENAKSEAKTCELNSSNPKSCLRKK